ncbi:23S rRNA (guanosine(2251)-2'-O)-methyltransferase RlmB [Celerinatantimonas yamalensis]|uniref:23S rRNA (guanosine-2'-O-)-methyltransferase RlmB n=1 Tax=Celerinatantimonas yamalensis TaxID=559956 RepID=A0ABW9G5K6_9GAMM
MSRPYYLYGLHAVQAVLERHPERVIDLAVLQGRDDARLHTVLALAYQMGLSVQQMSRKALDERADDTHHQGVVAKVKASPELNEQDLPALIAEHATPLLLVLDGVTDPHNLGACLRNADAAGVVAVIVPKDKSAALSATARKVAVGAAENVPLVTVTNLARTLKLLQKQGVWVVGTAGEAQQLIYDCQLQGPIALVMGAEGQGMRRLTRETCDELVKLPMAGSVSSLNVSVAAGICLFEAVRQRRG